MANINLNKYYRKSSDIVSPVDSRIILNKTQTDKEYYGDIRLDLKIKELKERPLNAKESTNDIQKITNEQSIITSLRNIFNTHECSRLLNPQMKFELKHYLFQPLTQTKAWFIGYDIYQSIPIYEPRVKISHVSVIPNNDNGCYHIKITISIPSLSDQSFTISSILNPQGYYIDG